MANQTNTNINAGVGPSDISAEKTVLGTILFNNVYLERGREYLTVDCFTTPLHRNVYKAIMQCEADGEAVNVTAVMNKLDAMPGCNVSKDDLSGVLAYAEPEEFTSAVKRVQELCIRRGIFDFAVFMKAASVDRTMLIDTIVEEANARLDAIINGMGGDVETHREALELVLQRMDENRSDGPKRAVPTGFRFIDDNMGGFQPGQLVVIGGETSDGKSALAQTMALQQARQQYPVPALIISLEMLKEEIAARMVSQESGVEAKKVLYLPASDEEYAKAKQAIESQKSLPIYYARKDSMYNVDVMMSRIRSAVNRCGVRIVYVDYVQLVRNGENFRDNDTEARALEQISSKLQHLAQTLDITIVVLSQFNRDHNHATPDLARLRHSEGIAQAADIVLLINRPDKYNKKYEATGRHGNVDPKGTAEIIVAKGRGVGVGSFIVGFDAEHTRFYDLGDNIPLLENRTADEGNKSYYKPRS